MQNAHMYSTGGFILGEICLAIILRLLVGASYLNLGLLFLTSYSNIYEIFYYIVHNWINNNKVILINFYNNVTDVLAMKKAANTFLINGRNDRIIGGMIGAINR